MNLYKKCTAKLYFFLVIDATLALDDPFPFSSVCFSENPLERL